MGDQGWSPCCSSPTLTLEEVMRYSHIILAVAAVLYLPFWVRVLTRVGAAWGGAGGLTWA